MKCRRFQRNVRRELCGTVKKKIIQVVVRIEFQMPQTLLFCKMPPKVQRAKRALRLHEPNSVVTVQMEIPAQCICR